MLSNYFLVDVMREQGHEFILRFFAEEPLGHVAERVIVKHRLDPWYEALLL